MSAKRLLINHQWQSNLLQLLKQQHSPGPLTTTIPPMEQKRTTSPSAESETQLLKLLLHQNSSTWDQPQLLNLTTSISPPRLPQLLRNLKSSTTALKYLQWIQLNSPSILPQSHSILYQVIFTLACKEENPLLKLNTILQTSKLHNASLTINSATILVQHFGKAQMIGEVINVFNAVEPLVKNTHLCNTVIDVLYRWGKFWDARKVLDEMLQPESRFPPNKLTGEFVFSFLVKRDQLGKDGVSGDELIGLVEKLGVYGVFPDVATLTKMITKLGKSGDVRKAWDVLHVVMKMEEIVEVASFNALLVGLGRENNFQKMNILLSEMKETGIEPNDVTFGILIHHLCKSRRVDEALEVLENMKKDKEKGSITAVPDLISYNAVIKGLCVLGRQDEGLVLVESMISQHGYAPNAISYNALINGFCKAGEIERARELFDQMKEEGVPPDVITLNTLVDGMCKHGRISSALEFFSDMQRKGLKGNAITYTSLISAFCNVNNLDKAMDLFDEMMSSHCNPDSIVYYSLINGFSRAGRLEAACSIASKMKCAGFFLDTVSYNALISGFCNQENLDKVYELIEEMKMAGARPDEVTYNTLIATLSKYGDFSSVREWMTKMTDQGLAPTVVTYGALIHGYCKADKLHEALEIFSLMGDTSKVQPNTVIYNILIDSLCKEKKVDDALSLMDDMKVKGVPPNVVTFNAMFRGLRNMNCFDKAFELMNNMNKQAINPDFRTMGILAEWLSAANKTDRLKNFVQGYEV